MHQSFSIEEALRFGWEKTKQHSLLVFQIVLTIFALNVAQSVVQKVLEGTFTGAVAVLVLGIVSSVLTIGAVLISLKLARGEHTVYNDLVPPWSLIWRYYVLSFFMIIIIVIGLILLVIPGIYLAIRFSMAIFALFDGAEIRESLSVSSKLTEGVKWHLFGFMLVFILLNIVGALLLGVGLLVSIPVTMIANAHIYLKLKSHHHSHSHAAN